MSTERRLQAELDKVSKERDKLERKLESEKQRAKESVTEAEDTATQFERKWKKAKDDLRTCESAKMELESEKSQLQAAATTTSQELARAKGEVDDAERRAKRKLDDAQREIDSLKKDLRSAERRGGGGGGDDGSISSGGSGGSSSLEERKLERVQKQLDEAIVEKERAEKDLRDAKSELSRLKAELASASSGPSGSSSAAQVSSASALIPSSLASSSGADAETKGRDRFLKEVLEVRWSDVTVIKRIAGGGFAEVFEGMLHGERVGVKKLLDQYGEKAKRELMFEIELMNKLRSGYVVSLYAACFDAPNMCMVMEYFSRGSLGYMLWDKKQRFSWERRWQFVRDAGLAMNYLHSQDPPILHRDLKAANFLVTYDWRCKITDFGCSCYKNESKQLSDDFFGGTINWTAPEVLEGKLYDEKSDVYSFACVMLEIASREQPWNAYQAPAEQVKIKQMVLDGQRSTVPADTPDDFRRLMESCWDATPRSRPDFATVVAGFKRKGLLETLEEAGEKAVEAQEKLREELDIKNQECTNAQRDLRDAEKKLKEERDNLRELEDEKVKATLRVSELESKVAQLEEAERTSKRASETKQRALETSVRDAENDKKKSDKESSKLKNELREARDEVDELQRKFDRERKKVRDLEHKLLNA